MVVIAEAHGDLAGVAGDQLGGGALVEDPPSAHGDDVLAQQLGLVELMGDQQHRRSGLPQLSHRRPDLATGGRVEALGELVEDDQPRLVEQRQDQEESLPLTAAHARERALAQVGQAELLQQLVASGGPSGPRRA